VAHHVLRRRRHGDETEAERCYSDRAFHRQLRRRRILARASSTAYEASRSAVIAIDPPRDVCLDRGDLGFATRRCAVCGIVKSGESVPVAVTTGTGGRRDEPHHPRCG